MPQRRERDQKQDGRRQSRIDARRAMVVLALAGALVLVSGLAAVALRLTVGPEPAAKPRAVIIDQLAVTDPNLDFARRAATQLEQAGYRVDYFRPEEVTVDFYRTLPKRGYQFIIIRSHATSSIGPADANGGIAGPSAGSVGLFTNQPYQNDLYVTDQRARWLTVDSYPDRNITTRFFGITAGFVASAMQGRFNGATVILMGCSGLSTVDLAAAFVGRGARAFVSWDQKVTAAHTDAVTEALLGYLFRDRLDLRQAIARTMQDKGPDPTYGGRLLAYP